MSKPSSFDISGALASLGQVLEQASKPVALHEPRFDGKELEYVTETIRTGWVSSVGAYVNLFEKRLAELHNVSHAVATMNGTAALHMCLILCGVKHNDEVLLQDLTFVASANAIAYCGAIPHLCDSDVKTLGLDPQKLDDHLHAIAEQRDDGCYNRETGRRLAAIVAMHTFGYPVDLDELRAVADKWRIPFVEDSAESIGATYKGLPLCRHGLVSAVSFNGNKTITTGGGGAILTQDDKLGARAKHLTTTAKVPHSWEFIHDEVGYNYRLPNLNAALGCAQLERLDIMLQQKKALRQNYAKAFANIDGIEVFEQKPDREGNHWLVPLLLGESDKALRDSFISACHEQGFMVRPVWTLTHRLPAFAHCPRMDLSASIALEARIVNVPSSPFLAGPLS